VIILLLNYALELVKESLNLSNISPDLPEEFSSHYDARKYELSQKYLKDNTVFGLVSGGFNLAVLVAFISAGGFGFADSLARSFGHGPVITGVIFFALIALGSLLLGIPFSAYKTFVIEQKYGFNKTKPATFIFDIIKSMLLMSVLGAPVAALVIWFFLTAGPSAWLWCWLAVTLFQLFVEFIAPVVIMPLFNKFVPLEDGELKSALADYAKSQDFKMKGLYKMDGSKRSSKSNAFFTGFGKFRRIVLFDTLIERHSTDELVSVLAHEMGHYKKKHIVKFMAASVVETGFVFFLLSFFVQNAEISAAFKITQPSVYAGIMLFAFFYSPLGTLTSIVNSYFSRKYEFQADSFAADTYGKPAALVEALKKLSVDNLSNLTPHPFKVFVDYSHPPVLSRIEALRGRPGAR